MFYYHRDKCYRAGLRYALNLLVDVVTPVWNCTCTTILCAPCRWMGILVLGCRSTNWIVPNPLTALRVTSELPMAFKLTVQWTCCRKAAQYSQLGLKTNFTTDAKVCLIGATIFCPTLWCIDQSFQVTIQAKNCPTSYEFPRKHQRSLTIWHFAWNFQCDWFGNHFIYDDVRGLF